jgi:uncharacterized surface protein with fasciclin (FAS1) repeats
MKNLKNLLFVGIFTILLTGFWSCSDSEEVPVDNSITGIAVRTNNLSILVDALNRAGLTETLRTGGPFTVFAPTNTAFQNLLTNLGANSINDVPVPLLKEILLNHVVNGSVTSSQLTTGYIKTLSTPVASPTSKMSLFVNTAAGVRLNGVASVSTPNILASNGVIHVVDAVITLPTVVTFAVADPNFSTLVSALTTLTPSTDFVTVLSGNGPFTVFAPTNAAFTALNTELAPSGGIAGLPEATLANVLRYHVASGNVLSSALTPNGNTTVNPILPSSSFTITLPGTGGNIANVTDSADRASGIVAVDVQANNGVIHVLNRVLLP